MRTLQVGADRFPFMERGDGPPLLLVHGVPGDLRTFEPHLAILSTRFRAISFTQRWFGTGSWREDGPAFGTATAAADLIAFAGALGAGPVSLAAWSWGSQGALKAAVDRPDLFERILVYEPGFGTWLDDPAETEAFRADAAQGFAPVFAAAAAGDLDEALARMIDVSGGEGFFARQPERDRSIQRDNLHVVPRLLAQAPPPEIACADLAAAPVPITIAWGSETRALFAIPSRAAALCTGRSREIPGAGHMWPIEDPAGYAELIAAWAAERT